MRLNKIGTKRDPQVMSMLTGLSSQIGKVMSKASQMATAIPGLTLYRNTVPTAPNPCSYEPSLLVIPQGRKRVDLARRAMFSGKPHFY